MLNARLNLSIAQAVDCVDKEERFLDSIIAWRYHTENCEGAWSHAVYQDINDVRLVPETEYGRLYDDSRKQEACLGRPPSDAAPLLRLKRARGTIFNAKYYWSYDAVYDLERVKRALHDYGPVSAAIYCKSADDVANPVHSFSYVARYDTNVVLTAPQYCDARELTRAAFEDSAVQVNHAVLIVGYNDTKKAWRVLNSWGENLHDEGEFWWSYDCFINTLQRPLVDVEYAREQLNMAETQKKRKTKKKRFLAE